MVLTKVIRTKKETAGRIFTRLIGNNSLTWLGLKRARKFLKSTDGQTPIIPPKMDLQIMEKLQNNAQQKKVASLNISSSIRHIIQRFRESGEISVSKEMQNGSLGPRAPVHKNKHECVMEIGAFQEILQKLWGKWEDRGKDSSLCHQKRSFELYREEKEAICEYDPTAIFRGLFLIWNGCVTK